MPAERHRGRLRAGAGAIQAVNTLKAVLTKLDMDARYNTDAIRTRIANMFFPVLPMVGAAAGGRPGPARRLARSRRTVARDRWGARPTRC